MATAWITLEDGSEGHIEMKVTYKDGFDPKSHAHQHTNLVIKMMDEIATREGQPVWTESLGPGEATLVQELQHPIVLPKGM